ncbi:MAG: hypothetical protein DHS20C15_04320 [Planctomycetota bacterium]|nr:MAG: hypothetical protein DHS20C15_04320 [Planctomycetota bacterium]
MSASHTAPPRRSRWILSCLQLAGLLAVLTGGLHAQTWMHDLSADATPHHVAVSAEGRVAVVRSGIDGGGYTLFTPAGKLFSHRTQLAANGEIARPIASTFLDEVTLLVVGSLGERPWVASVDLVSGGFNWSRTLTRAPQYGSLDKIVINALGHAVVTGQLFDAQLELSAFTAAVNASTGSLHYRRVLEGPLRSSLACAQNGDLLSANAAGAVTITRSSEWGQALWQRTLSTAEQLYHPRLVETTSGDLIVVGVRETSASVYDLFALKTDAAGQLLWYRSYATYPGTTAGKTVDVIDLRATADGGVVAALTQPMPGNGTRDGALLRLSGTGDVQWFHTFGEEGLDELPLGVVVTPDGGFVSALGAPNDALRVVRLDKNGQAIGCPLAGFTSYPLPVSAMFAADTTSTYANYDGLWQDVASFSQSSTPDHEVVCETPCAVLGASYGSGTQGTGGLPPRLNLYSSVCLGYTPKVEIDLVLGGAPGLLFLSFGQANLPGLGGALLVSPSTMKIFGIQASGPVGVPGAGSLTLPMGLDMTWAQGLTVYLQTVFADPNGPTGKALSNGLRVRVE